MPGVRWLRSPNRKPFQGWLAAISPNRSHGRRLQTIGPSQAVIRRRLARRNHNGWTKKSWSDTVARRWLSIWRAPMARRFGKLMVRRRVAAAAAQQRPSRGKPPKKRPAKPPAGSRQTVKDVDGWRPPGRVREATGGRAEAGLGRAWAGKTRGAALPSACAGEARDPCRPSGGVGAHLPRHARLHNPAKCLELF